MFLSECPICEHENPAASRFCNACGAPLHLGPCPHCEAMNDLADTHCYKCGDVLAGGLFAACETTPAAHQSSKGDSSDTIAMVSTIGGLESPIDSAPSTAATPLAIHAAPAAPRRAYAIVATAVAAIVAVVAFYALRQQAPVDASQRSAASIEASGRVGPAGGGTIVNAEADGVRPVPIASSTVPAGTVPATNARLAASDSAPGSTTTRKNAAVAPEAPRDGSDLKEASPGGDTAPAKSAPEAVVRSAQSPQRAASGPRLSPDGAAALLVPRPASPGAGGRIEPPPARVGDCTEAVAALGLCQPAPTQRSE